MTCASLHTFGFIVVVLITVSCKAFESKSPPVIVINNTTVANGQTVRLSPFVNKVLIKCTATTDARSVTMKCRDLSYTINEYSGTFELTYNRYYDGAKCTCTTDSDMSYLYDKGAYFFIEIGNSGVRAVIGNVLLMTLLVLGRTILVWSTS
ncbi:uncharacterized protein LOC131948895 [Physella acuta]|uniref:uncharacterized protein LOC131948895 n=1 Tax=Physella acuta TaxID=109671 RepID=UPI0027DBB908|nr:uncharacterized protein LOC131948895 [Physella acuta]